ncbi:uncharacterized protein MYCFIDRAFT_216798 [Pseudocercospora fijiensis CIRAD86]|uniref:Protein kinase domain-containing protein n=1 Tax=Pseudocercospora fijiensis (strain CIRAD86) TaxID=383855 RepID=M3AP85_PSEFD|nr:uncharacterized protein MYCFIDRAFT_216798 [Pseudocercospora fijiensis CIRAD86]EME78933.1 hypothetical protein MYCFIDRAFT_216798 [Pseudocercospora fijiensis CIRAD86]
MSGSSQPDHERDLQALLQWIKRNTVESHDVTTGAVQPGGEFIPAAAVEEYLSDGGTYGRTKSILRNVFFGNPTKIEKTVAEKCPRILCILAELGSANLISEFVRYPNLHDRRLPFDSPRVAPKNFPVSTKDPDFYEAFYKKQWKYFAPELYPEIQAELLDEYVLPFERLELKGKGHDAWVYRATVHKMHDKLTQGSGSATRYTREVLAFEHVTNSGNRDMVGLIACHSSFKYRDTFNIILEYADHGSLQDFFDEFSSPTSGEMMIDFWESMFDTARAMYSIHEHFLGTDSNGNRTDVQGFKHVMEGEPEASVKAAFGTRTYGAPECYAISEHTMHARNDVKRSTDVWSLGCIYSEAVVWAVKGPKQLSQYRRERGLENSYLKTDFRDGACFHDGQRVLKAVGIQHDDLRRHFMDRDFITGKVIDNLIIEMLDHRAARRPSADQLVGKAEKQIALARISGGSTYTDHHTVLNEAGRVFQSPDHSRANTVYPYPNGLDIGPMLPSIADLQEVGKGPSHGLNSQTLPVIAGPSTHHPPQPPPPRPPPLITPANLALKHGRAVEAILEEVGQVLTKLSTTTFAGTAEVSRGAS